MRYLGLSTPVWGDNPCFESQQVSWPRNNICPLRHPSHLGGLSICLYVCSIAPSFFLNEFSVGPLLLSVVVVKATGLLLENDRSCDIVAKRFGVRGFVPLVRLAIAMNSNDVISEPGHRTASSPPKRSSAASSVIPAQTCPRTSIDASNHVLVFGQHSSIRTSVCVEATS